MKRILFMRSILRILLIIHCSLLIAYGQFNSSWSPMVSGTINDLRSISGSFAVGNNGTILTYNGTNWVQVNSGTTNVLTALSFPSNTRYICGFNGTILKSTDYGITWE